MKKHFISKSKKGLASIYVVVFSSLLFGVITLSFVRLIVSDSFRTMNDDLSQSAYDAALAGIEDAKKAILDDARYKDGWDECNEFKGGEEVYLGSTANAQETIDQAYTCVKAKGELDDYRTTLTPNDRARVIKLPDSTNTVDISWYSTQNSSKSTTSRATMMKDGFQQKGASGGVYAPPVITVQLIGSDDSSTAVLYPVKDNGNNSISMDGRSNEGNEQSKQDVNCNIHNEYACVVSIDTSGYNEYLVITLPYGDEDTDFLVDARHPFQYVQYEVDSTGRANNVYRRVMARVEVVDQTFAVPEYGVYSLGGFEKNFWVTYNNWGGPNSGNVNSSYVAR